MQKTESRIAPDVVMEMPCPACGHHVAVRLLEEQHQPLATVAWPASRVEAQAMKRLPLAFVRCVHCGHVYNSKFRYEEVPYSERPNLMFNRGASWTEHLKLTAELLLEHLGDEAVVVEIGCGEGHLLRSLAAWRPRGRFVGFDPNGAMAAAGAFEPRQELFVPPRHVAELKPDLIISRHVLEHLVNPLGFLQSIAFATSWAGIRTRVFIEVPCIDRVLETGRTVDFYYEHNSHFTTGSFTHMLNCCADKIELLWHSYNREVISCLMTLGAAHEPVRHAMAAQRFRESARHANSAIRRQLAELAAGGRRIAIWGGTGKAAAFMNAYGVDADRFPIVVDSDPMKVGTFVPGQGQPIRSRDWLLDNPSDVIIIPMQWRAADVVHELEQAGIRFRQILIEHEGRLVDYFRDDHPYRPAARVTTATSVGPPHRARKLQPGPTPARYIQ